MDKVLYLFKKQLLMDTRRTFAGLKKVDLVPLKAAKYKTQRPSTGRATLFPSKFWVDISSSSPCKVERGSTLSYKSWLCCSFFIKLTTCHATNKLMLRDELRVFASRMSPRLGCSATTSPQRKLWRYLSEY